MSGADILEHVVRAGWKDGLADRNHGVSATYVARLITGVADARKIMQRARKLADAGLITIKRQGDTTFLRPTERGIEVDEILERITAARGGEFAPRYTSGISPRESLAL